MAKFIASSFSINMFQSQFLVTGSPVGAEFFKHGIQDADFNVVNPRHTTTAALVGLMTDKPCEGGFASLTRGDEIWVILPSREFMNRDAAEIELKDLDGCQFWRVEVR